MPTQLINRATGQPELVEDADLPGALASDKYEQPQAVAASRFGQDTYVTPDILRREANVTKPADPTQTALAQGHAIRERANTGVVADAKAALGGAASALTFGMANPFEDAQEFNPGFSIGGQIAGSVIPGLLGDEAGFGALARDPVALENVGGSLSSRYLYTGETLANADHAGAGLERALSAANGHLDTLKAAAQLPEDLGGLDAAGLRTARETELDNLASAHASSRAAAKSSAVDDALAFQSQLKDANPYLVTNEGPESATFAKSSRSLRNSLDNVEGLRESPGKLIDPLQRQAQALERTIAERDAIATKLEAGNKRIAKDLAEDLETLPDNETSVTLTGKAAKRYSGYADVKLTKGQPLTIAKEDAQGFLDALQGGEIQGQGQEAMGKLQGLLDANRALQAKIKAAAAPAIARSELTSARLTAIDAARDALATPKTKSLAEEMLSGSIMGHVTGALSGMPIVGPMLGAKAGQLATDLVFNRAGKVAGAAAERTKAAVGAFLDTAKNSPLAPIASTKALAALAYGPPTEHSKAAAAEPTLANLFKARTSEIKAQTAFGPDGAAQMRPEAREAMAKRIAPLRQQSPIAADRLETQAAARLEWLSNLIPRKPDTAGIQVGPDRWQPSEQQMRSVARSMWAAENPHEVEDRLASGATSPEEAAAYRANYPERFSALVQRVQAALPTLQQSLPFGKRIALSLFTGVAVDPSMEPQVLAVLQSQFAAEEGTQGGTQAPKPKPSFGAFGSVRKDVATPSQRRAEGA